MKRTMMKQHDIDHWLDNEAEAYMTELGLRRGQTVLDFGCNQGYYSVPAAKAVGPNGNVYALDKDADVLNTVRGTATEAGLKQVTLVNTYGGTKTPLADETVDVVFLHEIFPIHPLILSAPEPLFVVQDHFQVML